MLTFYDAAYPLNEPPVTDGVCFYIGGDTPRIWTVAEINAQPARYRLPVFVRSDPGNASAVTDVVEAVSYLHQIGAPTRTLVAWDTEIADDPAYISAVYRNITPAGYKLIVYGTQSIVTQEENPDGLYWGADWTGSPFLHTGDAMTQYVSFSSYDESLAEVTLPFWDTHHDSPPSSVPPWQERLMQALPTITIGATGTAVRTVQGLCSARGQVTIIDGVFGPATASAVKAVQASTGITADGVVGPVTWPVLITG
jgi:hypothetical protein